MNEQIIILGIILSIIFYELTDLSPGGVIVPGYLSLFFNNPKRIAVTLIVAIMTSFLVKFLSKYLILYGRRRFVTFIIISFLIGSVCKGLSIGILIPGILAQDIDRNGYLKTFSALLSLTIILKIIIEIFYQKGFPIL